MADDPISELCEAIRPVVRRQVQAAVGDREIRYDTDEIVRAILANPDVVLRALGGKVKHANWPTVVGGYERVNVWTVYMKEPS